MPFYEYECPSCRFYTEVMQKISDAPLKKCPSCGKAGFKRLISAPVFRLKGSGWYETDFKSDKEGKRNLAGGDRDEAKPGAEARSEGQSDSKSDGKSDGKSEGKPDSKADAKPADTPAKSETAAPAKSESTAAKSRASRSTASRRGASASKPAARKPAPGRRRK